jgi:hypothetical protein
MTPNSPEVRRVALRLLARDRAPSQAASDGPDPVAATKETFQRRAAVRSRWFGPFGFHALFSRALAEARSHHSALAGVQIRSAMEPSLEGLPESIALHGTDAVNEGIVATLMAFIDLLSRLIGEDMALKLLDPPVPLPGPQASEPGSKGGAS